MREIKIRYALKSVHTGKIHFKRYYLNQIETGLEKLFDTYNYEILGKDLFTGHTDKNGKEIYEGDICQIVRFNGEAKIIGKIYFEEGCFKIENGCCFGTEFIGQYKADIIEIIGNVYENLELLKWEIQSC